MEFIDGEDLASLLRRIGRLPADKALEIARQLCAGLAAAHDAGVLHRDLKPHNVMIDGRGRARITDFGVAALAREIRSEHVVAGTPAYMAPEQLRGEDATCAATSTRSASCCTRSSPASAPSKSARWPTRCSITPRRSAVTTPSTVVRDSIRSSSA